jgi:hypothetical protein
MLSEDIEVERSDFEAENAMLIGDFLSDIVEIVIGGIPTVLEVRFMWLFVFLSRLLMQGSISMNLVDSMRLHVDLRKVEVSLSLLGNIYPMPDIILPGVHFAPLLGQHTSFSTSWLHYLSLLHKFRSQGLGFGLHLLAGWPE